MEPTFVLLSAFLISVVALGFFIWSMRNGAFHDPGGAQVIFTAHEIGHAEDPAASPDALTELHVRKQRTPRLSTQSEDLHRIGRFGTTSGQALK